MTIFSIATKRSTVRNLLDLLKATFSFVMSVRLFVHTFSWNNSANTGMIFMKFYISVLFENLPRKFKFHWNPTRITATLHEDQYTFFIRAVSVLLRIRILSDRFVKKIKTHILCPVKFFFSFENRAVHEIMWKNFVERGRPQMTIWRIRIACWIPKATDTHSEYVILIVFLLQQWLHENTSLLRYTQYFLSCLQWSFCFLANFQNYK